MDQFKISDGRTSQARRYRALIAYTSLIIASLLILLAGHEVINYFGFNLDTRIRDVSGWKTFAVFISMLPIVAFIIWLTLIITQKLCLKLNV